jgi:hypothetical protein
LANTTITLSTTKDAAETGNDRQTMMNGHDDQTRVTS